MVFLHQAPTLLYNKFPPTHNVTLARLTLRVHVCPPPFWKCENPQNHPHYPFQEKSQKSWKSQGFSTFPWQKPLLLPPAARSLEDHAYHTALASRETFHDPRSKSMIHRLSFLPFGIFILLWLVWMLKLNVNAKISSSRTYLAEVAARGKRELRTSSFIRSEEKPQFKCQEMVPLALDTLHMTAARWVHLKQCNSLS